MMNIDKNKEVRKAVTGLFVFFGIGMAIRWFELGFIGIYLLIFSIPLGIQLIRRFWYKKDWDWAVLGKSAVILGAIMSFMYWVTGFGMWGFIFGMVAVHLYALWRRRHGVLRMKYYFETVLWGKPLKEYIKEGKKPPKVKIVRTIQEKEPKKEEIKIKTSCKHEYIQSPNFKGLSHCINCGMKIRTLGEKE